MVNSLDPVYDTGRPVTPAIIASNEIETYGSFKPLMAMEFPIEHVFCQGCLTRPFANFVSLPLFLRVVIASPKERDDI